MYLSIREVFQIRRNRQIENKTVEELYCKNSQHRKVDEAIFTLDKMIFKSKRILKDKEGHFIMRRSSINQKDILIINVHTPNNRDSEYSLDTRSLKNLLLGGHVDVPGRPHALNPREEVTEVPYPRPIQTWPILHLAILGLYPL